MFGDVDSVQKQAITAIIAIHHSFFPRNALHDVSYLSVKNIDSALRKELSQLVVKPLDIRSALTRPCMDVSAIETDTVTWSKYVPPAQCPQMLGNSIHLPIPGLMFKTS